LTVFIVYSFGSVAFNVGEILPRGWFCYLRDLGGDFGF